jgi:hypothetical protein
MNNLVSNAKDLQVPNKTYRLALLKVEKAMRESRGFRHKDTYKITHEFTEGLYIRKLLVPKGHFIMSYVHKDAYPLFMLCGDWTEVGPNGNERLQAPQAFITKAGAQKMGFAHSDTVWATVHHNPDNGRDISKIEKRIYADHYDEVISIDAKEMGLIDEIGDLKQFDIQKFRKLSQEVIAHEKEGFWSDWTEEQRAIYMTGDWEAFSKSRGYSAEEIETHRQWVAMKEYGDSLGLNPLKYVQDLFSAMALKNMAKDTKGEILKSSHIPSSKRIPYKEELCLESH